VGVPKGDPVPILESLDAFSLALDLITPDHAPLDWARLHHGQGQAFTALGETGESDVAFQRALQAFDKVHSVLGPASNLALRATAAIAARLALRGQTNFLRMLWKFNSVYSRDRQLNDHARPVKYAMRRPEEYGHKVKPAELLVHERPVALTYAGATALSVSPST